MSAKFWCRAQVVLVGLAVMIGAAFVLGHRSHPAGGLDLEPVEPPLPLSRLEASAPSRLVGTTGQTQERQWVCPSQKNAPTETIIVRDGFIIARSRARME